VPMLPFAAFLVGALLSLLVPVALLIALSVWYMVFVRRVRDIGEADKPGLPESTILAGEEPIAGPGSKPLPGSRPL
jgi:hypothetical protein